MPSAYGGHMPRLGLAGNLGPYFVSMMVTAIQSSPGGMAISARQRSIMNSVLLATSAPFFVAYGDRESPFAKNNLILTGSLLGFMLADEALDWMSPKPGTMRCRTGR